LQSGRTANNKPFHDAQMIINLKDAYIFIMENKITDITAADIKNLHKLAMQNLLPENQIGFVRKIPVRIGGSDYLPSTDTILLEDSLMSIVANSKKYDNTFEKSIYFHNNLAYLQYFTDGNKMLSRIIQTASMVWNNKMPLYYLDESINDYKKSLISYYESGDYSEYKDFFINNYEKSLEKTVKFLKKREKGIPS
jgi:Fic family protein